MSVFQHPHLIRGVVKTPHGAFVVARGLVEMPDEVGESLGWRRVECDTDSPTDAGTAPAHAHHSLDRKPSAPERRVRA